MINAPTSYLKNLMLHNEDNLSFYGSSDSEIPHEFQGENFDPEQFETMPSKMVRLRCKDVLPLLQHAIVTNKSWPADFGDDPIEVTEDLYQILLQYRSATQRRAA